MPGPCSDFRDSSILLLRKFPTWSENPFIPKQRQKRFDLLPFAHIPETRLQLVSHSNMNNQQGHLLSLPLLALMTLQGTQQQTLPSIAGGYYPLTPLLSENSPVIDR